MAHTAMRADLSKAIEVFPHLEVELIRDELRGLSVLEIALTIEKVVRDLELARVLDDSDDAIDFLIGEGARTLRKIDVSLLEDEVGEATTDTLDRGERVHDLLPALDVCVENTQDVLELLTLHYDRHDCWMKGR